MTNSMLQLLALVVTLLAATSSAQKSAVLGIDLGSQFFKVAYIKTGGFDVVLNEASKRKSPTALAFVDGERSFGDVAYSQKPRYPKNVLIGMHALIGKLYDSKAHEQGGFGGYHLPFGFKKDENRSTILYDMDGAEYSPDELLGMLFYYIKDISQKHLEQSVSECVITVPPFFTEHERRMVIEASEMADLSVIMLVNDNTAVALRYGVEVKQTGRNNVLFVDVGSSHTTATVVSYFEKNITEYTKMQSLEILGTAWTQTGGAALDVVLTEHFANDFNKKHNKNIHENPKAITKLRKDTEKIKTVLSANKEAILMIESLMDDIDFKSKITREDMETMCADVFKAMEEPMLAAIEKSGLKIDEINEVIPFGAGTRVPKVKEMVLAVTKREVWQPSINTDEAAALGAAFVAANFSKSFRLKPFHVYDYFPYSVGIDMNGKKATIFKPGSVMEAKKTISQPISNETQETDELKVTLSYDDEKLLPAGTPTGLSTYTITGMKDAMAKYNVTGTPKISIAVGLHRDAIVEVLHAELKVHSMDWVKKQRFVKKNVTEEVIVEANKTNSSNSTNATEKKEEDSSAWSYFSSSSSSDETKEENATVIKKNVTREKTVEIVEENLEKKLHTVRLTSTRQHDGVAGFTDESLEKAQARHLKLVDEEADRVARANAKNDVEAFIFTAREKMDGEGFDQISTEEEREGVSSKLTDAEDWLWEDGDNVEPKIYIEKTLELKALVADMFYRYNQLTARPAAVENFKAAIADARKRVGDWVTREEKRIANDQKTWIHKNETDRVTKMCEESEAWLAEKETELETAGLLVKPPFSATEISQYIKPLSNEVAYLRHKPKPKMKKKKTNTTNSTNASNSSNASESTANATTTEEQATEEPKAASEDAPKEEVKEEVKEEAKAEEASKDLPTDEL